MRSKFFARLAAMLIIALVSAAFLRPVENTGFIGVADLYTAEPEFIPVTSTGDTDLLRVTAYAHTLADGGDLTVRFESSTDVLLGAWSYAQGQRVEFGDAVSGTDKATVDFLLNGEWMPALRIGFGDFGPPMAFCGEYDLTHSFSYSDPGTYRINYYFRELESYEPLDTVGSQRTVSFILTIPELDAEKPDLFSVSLTHSAYNYPDTMTVRALVRAPIGGEIYLDRTTMRLEKRMGDVWVEATPREEMASAVENLPAEGDDYLVSGGMTSWLYANLYIPDADARWRLILDYYDNEQLSGERRTLTLNLDFSEVEQ